jgi:hypothetical protein
MTSAVVEVTNYGISRGTDTLLTKTRKNARPSALPPSRDVLLRRVAVS